MALLRPETPHFVALDIAAYSDVELDQYLEAHGRSTLSPAQFAEVQSRLVTVEDLSEDFFQRLR